jgi:hypothetical protein
MKINQAKKILDKFSKDSEKDNDTFIACYFSRKDDKFYGYVVNLDMFDWSIVCDHVGKRLSKKFIIPPKWNKEIK